jgi:hypothetical protein
VLGREIAAPDDLQLRVARLELATGGHGIAELRAGHDRHAQHARAALADESIDRLERVRIEITVDNGVVVAAFE